MFKLKNMLKFESNSYTDEKLAIELEYTSDFIIIEVYICTHDMLFSLKICSGITWHFLKIWHIHVRTADATDLNL